MQMKKKILSILLIVILVALHINGLVVYARDEDFNDVSSEYWAYNTIMELSDKGIIDGFDDNTFNPNGEITREQFIKLLVCATDNVEENASTDNIEDISDGEWSYNYIANADECSIIGDEDYSGGFNPHGLLDRKTAVKWISKSINVSNNDVQTSIFKDIADDNTDFYASELYGYGIINGYEDGSFRPDNVLTRAEAATIIKNITDYLETWEIPDDEKELIDYADGVVKLDSERSSNILTKNTETTCEFSNINNDIKSLKKGNILVIPNCEKAPGGMAVKIKSITVRNNTATITKDTNISLDEIVDKIDINKNATLTAENVITKDLPKGVKVIDNSSYALRDNNFSYNNMTASLFDVTETADIGLQYSNGLNTKSFSIIFSDDFEVKPKKKSNNEIAGKLSMTGELNVSASIHPEIIYDKQKDEKPNISIKSDFNMLQKSTISANVTAENIEIAEIPFSIPFETFTVFVKLIITLDANGNIILTSSLDMHASAEAKFYQDNGKYKPQCLNKSFRITPDIELEMEATVTPKFVLRTGVAFLGTNDSNAVFSIFIDPEFDLTIHSTYNSKQKSHIHKPCIGVELTPTLKLNVGFNSKFIKDDEDDSKIKDFKLKIGDYTFNSFNFYAGLADKWEFGKGICPYLAEPEINTYTTRYGEVNSVTCPQFTFDYSDDWEITREDVYKLGQPIYEWVTLTNKNNKTIEINYISHKDLGGGKIITVYDVSKAADSQFVPGYAGGTDKDYSSLGDFMVGEIKSVGEYDMKTGDLIPFDGGTSYAVIPELYIGIHDVAGLSGYQDEFSFPYANKILFYATSQSGHFTDEEKQEVIKVLSTFKAVE